MVDKIEAIFDEVSSRIIVPPRPQFRRALSKCRLTGSPIATPAQRCTMAYLMGPKVAMTCQVLSGSTTYQDMGFTRAPKGMPGWMYGPVTIDVLNSGPTGPPEHPGLWAENVAGRVVSRATSVRFSAFGESVTLPVVNGTYLGRIVFMEPSDQAGNYTATAYDDALNVVGTTTIGKGVICAVTPDGVVINGQQGTADCPAASACH